MATLADSFLADYDEDAEEVQPNAEEAAAPPSTAPTTAAANTGTVAVPDMFASLPQERNKGDKKKKRKLENQGEEGTIGSNSSNKDKDHDKEDEDEEEKDNHDHDKEDDDDDDDDVNVKDINMDEDEIKDFQVIMPEGVGRIANLVKSPELLQHLETIEQLMEIPLDSIRNKDNALRMNPQKSFRGMNRDAEYRVIVKSNEFTAAIDNEISLVHKYVRDLYAIKFKELEQIVPNALDYARTVKKIGNETDLATIDWQGILPSHTILTITVAVSTGSKLSAEDLKNVTEACDTIITLDEMKRKIYKYVESRMELIAPNLSAVVGSEVAAKLLGIAGGLIQLSKIPSCNVQVLGVKRKTMAGFSVTAVQNHMGLIMGCDLVRNSPSELRRRLLRVISGKVALAARIDSYQTDNSGEEGKGFREEIERKLEKWQEPPPPKKKKALPVPDDKPRKRRGGKRFRKRKEMFRMSELQKAKNRMGFNVPEKTDEYTGEGFGLLGQDGTGNLRIQGKNRASLTSKQKRQQQQQQQQNVSKIRRIKAASSGNSGLASTIAFTPHQGMELINPEALKKDDVGKKYFSDTGSFSGTTQKGSSKPSKPPVPVFKPS